MPQRPERSLSSSLPRAVRAGSFILLGRRVRVALLQDGRRILLDEPVADILPHQDDPRFDDLQVRFLDRDGRQAVGLDERGLLKIAIEYAIDGGPVCDDWTREIAERCGEWLQVASYIVDDALAAGGAS